MTAALDKILELAGLPGALLIIALSVIAYLYKQNTDLHKRVNEAIEARQQERVAVFEKRLEETKELLILVQTNNSNSAELKKTVEAMMTALNELIKGFASMVHTGELSRERFQGQANRMEQILNAISNKASGRS